ncbi:inorganic phosphate transporter [Hydrogenophaga sp.]|uniref:inorganic phosphate transporter n=1 Tax=Hydrogenophaga sp. TaxID=1904254 RepID=UPI0027321F4D|nr:inorganic phosphate transporter [Hydrogenophaga sp.]MDP2018400.1 inorganic phosphate transporter [Hydrogenophaga sp.]MDP3164301.1 inorganic phosphate transporter [Hydrogenophaga sp.]MDP3810197.1 inorganic phosphate transporter [Hydrogenophaga sp.]
MPKSPRARFIAKHQEVLQFGTAVLFLLLVGGCAWLSGTLSSVVLPTAAMWMLVVAAVMAGYMAMNIGANDVANNMGPVVGSGAMSLGWALAVAAVFEALGAVVAGGDVIGTVKGGIIDARQITDASAFVWVMFAALIAAALWINLATALDAPVSTTHSIIGAITGAGVAAGGWGLINWSTLGDIALGWLVSPLAGGALAAAFLYLIKRCVTYRSNGAEAARRVVPVLIALMVWAYTTYLLIKGLGQVWRVELAEALVAGAAVALVTWWLIRLPIRRMAVRHESSKKAVNHLFTWPLIGSAALLSFAHGANDVANAIGPLAAIHEAIQAGAIATRAQAPLWILVVGALGLSVGLVLYGARLIRIVGREITELDNMRAYAIAMAVSLTVIVASQFGMPVSTTQISIGAVFGVGFLRQWLKVNYARMEAQVLAGHQGQDRAEVEAYLLRFSGAEVHEKKRMLADMKLRKRQHEATQTAEGALLAKKERKLLKKAVDKAIVKRSLALRIVAAWIVTLPATAALAAVLFHVVRAVLR